MSWADPPFRLVIVGAGAIGAGIGGLQWDAGVDVLLVARGAHGRALAETGLDRQGGHALQPSDDLARRPPAPERGELRRLVDAPRAATEAGMDRRTATVAVGIRRVRSAS